MWYFICHIVRLVNNILDCLLPYPFHVSDFTYFICGNASLFGSVPMRHNIFHLLVIGYHFLLTLFLLLCTQCTPCIWLILHKYNTPLSTWSAPLPPIYMLLLVNASRPKTWIVLGPFTTCGTCGCIWKPCPHQCRFIINNLNSHLSMDNHLNLINRLNAILHMPNYQSKRIWNIPSFKILRNELVKM